MQKYSNLNGIVIKMHNAKEADRVVHVLSETGERVVVFAKGIKKTKSRKAHAIDLLNVVNLKLIQGRGGMQSIMEAKLVKSPSNLKQDLSGLMAAQAICEIADKFIQEDVPDSGYYKNLVNLVESAASSGRIEQLMAAMILRFLYVSGDLPKLNEDVATGEHLAIEGPRYLTNQIGYTANGTEAVSDRIYKTQRFMLKHDFAMIGAVDLNKDERMQILQISIGWLKGFIQKDLPAMNLYLSTL